MQGYEQRRWWSAAGLVCYGSETRISATLSDSCAKNEDDTGVRGKQIEAKKKGSISLCSGWSRDMPGCMRRRDNTDWPEKSSLDCHCRSLAFPSRRCRRRGAPCGVFGKTYAKTEHQDLVHTRFQSSSIKRTLRTCHHRLRCKNDGVILIRDSPIFCGSDHAREIGSFGGSDSFVERRLRHWRGG